MTATGCANQPLLLSRHGIQRYLYCLHPELQAQKGMLSAWNRGIPILSNWVGGQTASVTCLYDDHSLKPSVGTSNAGSVVFVGFIPALKREAFSSNFRKLRQSPSREGAARSLRSSVARVARSLRCLRRLRRPPGCPFESRPTAPPRTSRLPSLVAGAGGASDSLVRAARARWALAGARHRNGFINHPRCGSSLFKYRIDLPFRATSRWTSRVPTELLSRVPRRNRHTRRGVYTRQRPT